MQACLTSYDSMFFRLIVSDILVVWNMYDKQETIVC